MPRRLTTAAQRKRLGAHRARLDGEAVDVDSAVNEALAQALAEFRRANAEPRPPDIPVVEETPAETAEQVFEAGFLLAAVAFWDDIARGRERLRTARRGSGSSAAQRKTSPEVTAAVLAAADAYRNAHPYSRRHSTRAMATRISGQLRKPIGTVRAVLALHHRR